MNICPLERLDSFERFRDPTTLISGLRHPDLDVPTPVGEPLMADAARCEYREGGVVIDRKGPAAYMASPSRSLVALEVVEKSVSYELCAFDAAVVGGEALVGDVHLCEAADVAGEVASFCGGRSAGDTS